MLNFEFYSPTRVVFGKDAEKKSAELVKWAGGSRVLLVYGGGSAVRSGLLDRVDESLKAAGIATERLAGVKPNPLLSLAREGIRKALDFKADLILALGGGSAIDTAKAVAIGAAYPDKDIWDDIWLGKFSPSKALPVGVVLTISAAGSETSNSAVLTNDETLRKSGINTDINRPKFAIMNPELTYTLPKNQIANGVSDIMMHTMERYFSSVLGNDFTDAVAEALLRDVVKYGPVMLENPSDYQAASEIMWCGSVSHNGMTGLGGNGDFATHQLSMPLSAVFDSAHGAALTAVWGDWARYVLPANPARFAQYGREVFGDTGSYPSTEAAAVAAVDLQVAFFKSIGMPTCFTELGIGLQDESQLRRFASLCSYNGGRTIGGFKTLTESDIYEIYKMANR